RRLRVAHWFSPSSEIGCRTPPLGRLSVPPKNRGIAVRCQPTPMRRPDGIDYGWNVRSYDHEISTRLVHRLLKCSVEIGRGIVADQGPGCRGVAVFVRLAAGERFELVLKFLRSVSNTSRCRGRHTYISHR